MTYQPHRRRRAALVALALMLLGVTALGFGGASAVLQPRIDSPERVDAIVVVAGAVDDRYNYAKHLARSGAAGTILVSRPTRLRGRFASLVDNYCASTPVLGRDGRIVEIKCFTPDVDTTEGETTAATRFARSRGWKSLLVVTYWGHVSRVRIYFEQCFNGSVFVTDTPEPTMVSRRYALQHETAGYVKAFLKPAC